MSLVNRHYEAVLFDFDGVVRSWDQPELLTFEPDAGYEVGTVFAVAFSPEVNHPAITGGLTWEQWRAETIRRLRATHGSAIEPVADQFFAFQGEIDHDMVDLIGRVRDLVPVGLLTNNNSRFESYLASVGLDGHFDEVVNTHRIGVAKPEPDAFHIAVDRLGVSADRCLFIDDHGPNVEGARAAGLESHLYEGIPGLLDALRSDVG